jgi:parallel beta-helix repeat protein
MKNMLPFAVLFIFNSFSFTQTHIQSGPVFGTWPNSGSPYYIEGEIAIPAGQTLTIEPGVLVEFQGHYKLNVQGQLLAVGTETDSIIFTINDTTGFHNWYSPDGGWHGIRFGFSSPGDDTSRISYCKLEYGKAVGSFPDNKGGAIAAESYDNLVITNTLITQNIAVEDGGGLALSNSNIIIYSNTIYYNGAGSSGGGIAVYSCDPHIINNLIYENVALNSAGGISLYYNANPNIYNNIIFHNFAEFGGGLQIETNCNPIIKNNIIVGDSALSEGGGVDLEDNCNAIFINNTIVYNVAPFGGGIDCEVNSNPIFRNTILWGNIGTVDGNQVHLFSEDSDPDFYYCDVEGGSEAFGLWYGGTTYFTYTGIYENNMDSIPEFTSLNQYIYLLDDLSPCIDTGDPDTIYNDIEDLSNPGFAEWPSKGTLRNDIGVYGGPYVLTYEYVTAIEDESNPDLIKQQFSLLQNYPNPFNPSTTIKYQISEISFITLKIYDVLGNEVATIVNEEKQVGEYEIEFSGNELTSGIYFYQLRAGNYIKTKKMLILK